jgi:hypothetical protein
LIVKLANQSPLEAREELVDLGRVDIGEHLALLPPFPGGRLPGLRRGAGAVEHLRPRRRAVEEEVVKEAALRREQRGVGGAVALRRGGGEGGEEVVGEQRVEEARRLGPREADHGAGGQARGQHARVGRRARVERPPREVEAQVRGEAARERRHGWKESFESRGVGSLATRIDGVAGIDWFSCGGGMEAWAGAWRELGLPGPRGRVTRSCLR